jgi:hypothetical protein
LWAFAENLKAETFVEKLILLVFIINSSSKVSTEHQHFFPQQIFATW